MIDLFKVRQAIRDLHLMGIEIDSFHCTPETWAEIQGASIKVDSVVFVRTPPQPLEHLKEFPTTLCGIPIKQVAA